MNDTNHVLAQVDEYLQLGGLFNPELMEHGKVRDLIIVLRDRLVSAQHANERDRVRLVVHLQELQEVMHRWRWIPDGETQNAEADGRLSKEVDEAYRKIKEAMNPLWAMARDLTDSPGSAGRAAGVKDGTALAMQDRAKSEITDEMIELAAVPIYDLFVYDQPTGTKPAWQPRGSSIKQDEARRIARQVLKAVLKP